MNRTRIVIGAALIAGALIGGRTARAADVAPPEFPPGAAVGAGEPATQVQMVSEDVLLVIAEDSNDLGFGGLTASLMSAHVTASFVMRNQGSAAESFDVRFPLGAPSGFGDVGTVENFAAWVDDTPAAITEIQEPGEFDSLVPWATWPAEFPPGTDVVIRVEYDVLPVGWRPYGEFHYLLETGAGWFGPIGEGTITYRLPYEVNETNTALNPDGWGAPSPGGYEVQGDAVVWRFSELEPTAGDNVLLTVLAVPVWEEIVAAREEADANPDSAEAAHRLAAALRAALSFKYGLEIYGNSVAVLEESKAAYQRALELDPQNVDLHVEYLDLLMSEWTPFEPSVPPADMIPVLEAGLALDPTNEELLNIQSWVNDYAITATPGPSPTPTAIPTRAASETPPATEVAEAQTPGAQTPAATASPSLAPTPTPDARAPRCIPFGLIALPLALVLSRRRAMGRGHPEA